MKHLFFVFSIFIIPFEIINILLNVLTIIEFFKVGLGWNGYSVFYTLDVIKGICVIALCLFFIICILRKTNFTNSVRYSYEEYKAHREKKKAEKLKTKTEKLQKLLNEIEKDTE